MKIRTFIAVALVLAAGTLINCSDAATAAPTQAPPPPQQGPAITRIVVTPAVASVPRGQQWPFQAECYDANNVRVPTPPGVVWTIEAAVVGTIEALGPNGQFRANQTVTATIRASLGQVSGTAAVSIP